MTDDMHSDNPVIQGIAESFWEVTEGTARECLDLAEIAYNAACTAGMVTPNEDWPIDDEGHDTDGRYDDGPYPSGIDGQDGPEGHPETAFCECGEAWFQIEGEPSGVAVERWTGDLVSYVGYLRCVGCDALKPLGWGGDQ